MLDIILQIVNIVTGLSFIFHGLFFIVRGRVTPKTDAESQEIIR